MKDLLNRNGDIEILSNIINVMTKNGGASCFAVDGSWGCGKSWVLDRLERRLQGIGDDEKIDLAKAKGNYFVFHYNAWENDYYDEPLIAVLTTMIEKLNELYKCEHFIKNIGKELIKSISKTLNYWVKKVSGVDIRRTAESIKNNAKISDEFNNKNLIGKAIKAVREHLTKLAESQMTISTESKAKFPLIFIVDELDRCLPEYAIKVLERLHHVFYGIPNSVMLLSIDKKQLNHTVQNIFGDSVNKEAYLAKFIDFTVNLNEGSIDEKLFWQEFDDYKKCFCPLYIDSLYDYDKLWTENLFLGIPMRERLQIVRKAKFIHSMMTDKKFQISVMYFEIYSVILNQIKKVNSQELDLYERKKLRANIADLSEINNRILKFLLEEYQQLHKRYGRGHNKINRQMDGEFYFTYMFYLYETEKHDLAVAYLGKEIEEMLIEEKDHIKLFEKQLNTIN